MPGHNFAKNPPRQLPGHNFAKNPPRLLPGRFWRTLGSLPHLNRHGPAFARGLCREVCPAGYHVRKLLTIFIYYNIFLFFCQVFSFILLHYNIENSLPLYYSITQLSTVVKCFLLISAQFLRIITQIKINNHLAFMISKFDASFIIHLFNKCCYRM